MSLTARLHSSTLVGFRSMGVTATTTTTKMLQITDIPRVVPTTKIKIASGAVRLMPDPVGSTAPLQNEVRGNFKQLEDEGGGRQNNWRK